MADAHKRVVILGAASGIAEATARLYAAEGARLLLVGRNAERLEQIATDLRLRGAASAQWVVLNLASASARDGLGTMSAQLGGIDHILLAYGIMPEQAEAEHDPGIAGEMIAVNFASAAQWCLAAANLLEAQGHGSLVVLGSPAGDRGRRRNYVYGATKAGLATLVEGIAHRFAGKGPRAVLVKPGPTDTAMTRGLPKGGVLWSTAPRVAAVVRRAADWGGPVQYAPLRWWLIMKIVRAIPAPIFNRVNF